MDRRESLKDLSARRGRNAVFIQSCHTDSYIRIIYTPMMTNYFPDLAKIDTKSVKPTYLNWSQCIDEWASVLSTTITEDRFPNLVFCFQYCIHDASLPFASAFSIVRNKNSEKNRFDFNPIVIFLT
jgi:hypothetical protein